MKQAELDRLSFPDAPHSDIFAIDSNIWSSEMLQTGDECNTRSVQQVAVVGEDVDVCSDMKALRSGNKAQGFSINSRGPTNSLVEYP